MAPEGILGKPERRNRRAIPQNIAQPEPCRTIVLGRQGKIFIFYERESAERFCREGEQRKNFPIRCPDDCRRRGRVPLKTELRRLNGTCHHRGHGLQCCHILRRNSQLKSPGAAKPLGKPLNLLSQMRSRQFSAPVFAFSGEVEAVIRSVVVGICSKRGLDHVLPFAEACAETDGIAPGQRRVKLQLMMERIELFDLRLKACLLLQRYEPQGQGIVSVLRQTGQHRLDPGRQRIAALFLRAIFFFLFRELFYALGIKANGKFGEGWERLQLCPAVCTADHRAQRLSPVRLTGNYECSSHFAGRVCLANDMERDIFPVGAERMGQLFGSLLHTASNIGAAGGLRLLFAAQTPYSQMRAVFGLRDFQAKLLQTGLRCALDCGEIRHVNPGLLWGGE